MANILKRRPANRRDVAYFRQRQKNRIFTELVSFFAQEAERSGLTKKDLAELLEKDPAQITRWLSAPSNFELDTLSDLLLALGAEMDHRIVRFDDRAKPNYAHPNCNTVGKADGSSIGDRDAEACESCDYQP
jgi:transcriptional regulator with XRE-family HTH domain